MGTDKSDYINLLDVDELLAAYEDYIDRLCIEHNIQDITQITQNVFNGLLLKCGYNISRPNRSVMKVTHGAFNEYDVDKVTKVLDWYEVLCNLSDKEISIRGFCNLTGIEDNTINVWGNNTIKSNTYTDSNISMKRKDIYKRLIAGREESLSNMLISGKRNPVGILGALNHRFGWSTQTIQVEQKPAALVSRETLALQDREGAELPPIEPPKAE